MTDQLSLPFPKAARSGRRRYDGLAAAVWEREGLTGEPFVMVVERNDGTPIAAIPVIDGNWNVAVKWGLVALAADRREHGAPGGAPCPHEIAPSLPQAGPGESTP